MIDKNFDLILIYPEFHPISLSPYYSLTNV